MKRYRILRDNMVYGPFTLEEIKGKQLNNNDLIWIDNKSQQWQYPSEISEICFTEQGIQNDVFRSKNNVSKHSPAPGFYVNRYFISWRHSDNPFFSFYPLNQENTNQSLLVENQRHLKESIPNSQLVRKRQKHKKDNFFTEFAVTALAFFLLLAGYHTKQIIQAGQSHMRLVSRSQIHPVLPLPEEKSRTVKEDAFYQNAISLDMVVINKEQKGNKKNINPFQWKKQVILLNDYKKKGSDYMNDSSITIQNLSPHFIDEVLIQVQYIKSDNQVIGIEEFVVRSIKPRSKRILEIQPCKQGIRLRHTLIDIYSKENQLRAVEI